MLTRERDRRRRAFGVRTALAVAAAFLLLGAVVARADPTFVLSASGAAPGDVVHFSIADTDGSATYVLEVGGQDVASGKAAEDEDVSGQFTMPNIGGAARAVTVEAEITQADETMSRTRTLRYVVPSAQAAQPPVPQPTSAPAPASVRAVAASSPAPRPRKHARTPHSAPKKRGTTPAPRPQPSHTATRHRFRSSVGAQHRSPAGGNGTSTAASVHTASGESPSGASQHRPAGNRHRGQTHKDIGSIVPALFAVPPPPVIFAAASGVAGHGGGPPLTALMVLVMLGLSAVTVAGGRLAPVGLPVDRLRFLRRSQAPAAVEVARPVPQIVLPEPAGVPAEAAAAWFAPIELAIVDERAMLATRSERKYVLDAAMFARLIRELRHHYLVLEIDGTRVFPYDTVYFDTPTLTTYRQHVQERRRRFKCRTRLYPSSNLCFFEVKMKGGRGETIKRRLELAVEEHGVLTEPALAFLEHELRETYGLAPPAALAPTLRTSYRRLTLVGHTGAERLTFDFDLTVASSGKRFWIDPGRVLLEAKGNGDGVEANAVLRRLGVRPVDSCSKYCLGVALTHPEVPSNPFHRLIRRHFRSAAV